MTATGYRHRPLLLQFGQASAAEQHHISRARLDIGIGLDDLAHVLAIIRQIARQQLVEDDGRAMRR